MRSYDLSPLFRSTVGFDRISRLVDSALQVDHDAKSYPPYNILKVDENVYRITLAVAGFSASELEVEAQDNRLTVSGRNVRDDEGVEFLHRGIASRAFQRTFQLADHIRVVGADVADGLLHIQLERQLPEALKPRVIPVTPRAREWEAAAK